MARNTNRPNGNTQKGAPTSRPRVQGQIGKPPVKRTLRTSEQINRIRERGAKQRENAGYSNRASSLSASSPSANSVNHDKKSQQCPVRSAHRPQVVKGSPSNRATAFKQRSASSTKSDYACSPVRGKMHGSYQYKTAKILDSSSIQGMQSNRRPAPRSLVIVAVAVVFLLIGFGIDSLMNSEKIYQGVTIGDVAVGGMTRQEASQAVASEYSQRVNSNTVAFFVSQQDMENPKVSDTDANIEEQISYEESLENRTQWTIDANAVEAVLDVDKIVEDAFQIGRDNGGLFSRLHSMLSGNNIAFECSFNDKLVDSLSDEMTKTVGNKRVNYDIDVKDGVASVTNGNDGNEVTSEWLKSKLNEVFLGSDESCKYVLEPEYLPIQITEDQAQAVADTVNNSISQGAVFMYDNQTWNASRKDLGSWVTTDVTGDEGAYELTPSFDKKDAKADLLSSLHAFIEQDDLSVTFEIDDKGKVKVCSNAKGTVPRVDDAIGSMNQSFFTSTERNEAPTVQVSTTEIPSEMSFSDAKAYGIISEISTFTTQYSSGNEARVHNIHTAAGLLDNSIAKANNGTWSFNDIAGEATEDKGYENAGAIVGGEYSDAIGGGICQVATTVFNAIYTAGYPVLERHNHTLYIDSYPEGRDAAIAYPDMNLRWENDTSSDVLLTMDYTDSSVTCSLWGIDPGYDVSTEYGEWKKGQEYSTTYKTDDSRSSGSEYIETTGVNGSSITIVRTVKDKAGNVLHTDEFESNYSPKNKVVVKGTG